MGGCREDVDRVDDGGEVGRGEVEGVELVGYVRLCEQRGEEMGSTQAWRIRWSRRDWYAS